MKRIALSVLSVLLCLNLHAQKIAVMQFAAGSGVNQEEVNGISSMFLTFFKPDGFKIIERTEVDRVITEQNFQKGNLTEKEMAKLGNILNLQYLVLGDINLVQNQYNVDTRVIDVETARIIATAGMTFSGVSFRDNMQRIAEDLSRKLSSTSRAVAVTQKAQNQNLEVTVLYGYLKVFPNDLGYFEQPPTNVISRINSSSQYGYNTWRIPTNEEVALMRASALIGGEAYMVSESSKAGIVRLVTDQGTAEEVDAERKAAAEKERLEREEKERLAEQRRIEEQKRLALLREQREKEEAKEREFRASLSLWEKAYLGGLSIGYSLKSIEFQPQGYQNMNGVYPGQVWTKSIENNSDYNERGFDFYQTISKNSDVNAYLRTKKEWYCVEVENNNGNYIYSTTSSGRGTFYYSTEVVYLSNSKSKGYRNVLQFDDPNLEYYDPGRYEGNNAIGRSEAARIPLMLGKRVSSYEASRLISDFKAQKIAQIEREKKAKADEEQRQLEEKKRQQEQERLEEQRRIEEQQRLEEQKRLEEQRRLEEEERLAEERRKEELRRQAEEAKKTAKIASVQVEHNVIQDGVKGMLIHIDFSIAGFKDVAFRCAAYFYYADGTPIKDTNNNYKTNSGTVCVGDDFSPRYDNSRYSDFKLWIPNKEIHVDTSSGPVDCYFLIYMYQKDNSKFLDIDYKYSFRMGAKS